MLVVLAKQVDITELRLGQQPRAQAIIDIMIVVGNFVGEVGQLGLQAGLQAIQEPLPDLAQIARIAPRTVFQDALARLVCQVQTCEFRVFFFQFIDDSQGLQIMLKPPEGFHAAVQRVLTRMAKRRMTQIVRETNRFDKLLIETERRRNRAADLRNLE